MKKLNIYYNFVVFLGIILLVSCNLFNEPENSIPMEKYPLCLIQTNGQNFTELMDDGYDGVSLWFISNDTKILVFSTNDLSHFNLETNKLTHIRNLQFTTGRNKALSPDQTSLVFVASDDLYKIDIDGINLIKLTNTPKIYERFPAFSQNGKKVIYTTSSDSTDQTISYFDLETNITTQIVDHNPIDRIKHLWYPIFGGNESVIYYIKSTTDIALSGDSLFHYNLLTNTRTLFDDQAKFTEKLRISANRERLIYSRWGNPCAVAVIDSNGSNMNILDNDVSRYSGYNISKNGDKILYWNWYTRDDKKDIFIINNDGTNRIRLGNGKDASFSTDENKIVFSGYKLE